MYGPREKSENLAAMKKYPIIFLYLKGKRVFGSLAWKKHQFSIKFKIFSIFFHWRQRFNVLKILKYFIKILKKTMPTFRPTLGGGMGRYGFKKSIKTG